MKTFAQYLSEAILTTELQRLRTDGGAFTKDTRRIKTEAELREVATAFKTWERYMYSLIYERLLGIGDDYNFDGSEPYENRQLRKCFWDLHLWNPFTVEFNAFVNTRDSIYSKLGRLLRTAFESLDYYLSLHPQASHVDNRKQELVQVAGVPVLVTSKEGKDDQVSFAMPTPGLLHGIEKGVNAIRAHGLSHALEGVHFTLYTNRYSLDKGGDYNKFGGNINLFPQAKPDLMAHVVVHEVCHHLFGRLSDERNQGWRDYINGHKFAFSPEDLEAMHKAYIDTFESMPDDYGYTKDVWVTMASHIADPQVRAKFKHFMGDFGNPNGVTGRRILMSPHKDRSDLEENWAEFVKEASGLFMLFAPSAYANKNTEEAFCEVGAAVILGQPIADAVAAQWWETVR